MSYKGVIAQEIGRGAGVLTTAAAVLVMGLAVAGGNAVAQAPPVKDTKAAPPAAAPAAPAAAPAAPAATEAGKDAPKDAAAAGAPKSAWVKLCEKSPLVKKDKDGKEVKEEKDICLTHHERLDGNSGMVLVSAAIRQVEGADKEHLMVMVPLGMAIPPGIKAAVYTKEQWDKAAKNEKIDEKALKPIELKYSLCHPSGCTAEIEATKELIDQMKTGGGLMVLAMNAAAQPIGFPVPLDGFTDAFAGKPVDNAEYKKARGQLMGQIRQRQADAYEKFKAEQLKQLPPQPGSGDAAPAAAAAAKTAPPAAKK